MFRFQRIKYKVFPNFNRHRYNLLAHFGILWDRVIVLPNKKRVYTNMNLYIYNNQNREERFFCSLRFFLLLLYDKFHHTHTHSSMRMDIHFRTKIHLHVRKFCGLHTRTEC